MSETTGKPDAPVAPPEEPKPAPEGEAPEQQEPSPEESRGARRYHQMTARAATLTRERDELALRVAQLEAAQRGQTQQPVDPHLQQWVAQEAKRQADAQVLEQKMIAFHKEGKELYPDWDQRCFNLQAMGADPQIAEMLMDAGPKATAALHDEPDELERIASIRSVTGRAVALGQFLAKLEAKPVRTVSRAPKPPTPVTQRTIPEFNEYTAEMNALVKHYSGPGRPP